jgi:hypothetical protein
MSPHIRPSCREKSATFTCHDDMSPTCRRHSQHRKKELDKATEAIACEKESIESLISQTLTKNLVAKNCKNTQSEITAEMSDPKLLGAFLNSVSSCLSNEQEGRVTAVVAKARYQRETENQTNQRFEHSARSCPSNAVIKVVLDSGSHGDLMFHKKGTSMHFLYLTRQAPNSLHTSNGSFLPKEGAKLA